MMNTGESKLNNEQDNVNLPAFPTMLRKMWSGGEVQQWISENIKPLFNAAAPSPVAQDERELPPLPSMAGDIDVNGENVSFYTAEQMHEYALAARAATPAQDKQDTAGNGGWKSLTDVQWMNIVNHDHAYESFSKDDAVHEAVKRTEAKLKELNATPLPAGSQQEAVDAATPDYKRFALAVLIQARDNLGSDVDGGMVQDVATECGLLVEILAEARCGDECNCSEYGPFPQTCYSYGNDVLKAIAAMQAQGERNG